MDCNNARLLLDFARPAPGELDAAEAAALQDHLSQCSDCGALARSEQRFDQAIGRAMKEVPIPDGLRTRLLAELDRRRDAWYRRFLTRRVLPLGAAAAAAVLLVVLGLEWGQHRRTRLDLAEVCAEVNEEYQPEKEKVNQWLRQVGGEDLEFPPRFNEFRLERYYLSKLYGQTVPTLYFAQTEGKNSYAAWVYVLSGKRFDLEKLKNQQDTIQSGNTYSVQSVAHPRNAQVMYMVVYSGGNLKRFFEPLQPPG